MLLCIIKFVSEDKAVALPHTYTRSRLQQFPDYNEQLYFHKEISVIDINSKEARKPHFTHVIGCCDRTRCIDKKGWFHLHVIIRGNYLVMNKFCSTGMTSSMSSVSLICPQ